MGVEWAVVGVQRPLHYTSEETPGLLRVIWEAKSLFLPSARAAPRVLQPWTHKPLLCETLVQINQDCFRKRQRDWGAHVRRGKRHKVAGVPCSQS